MITEGLLIEACGLLNVFVMQSSYLSNIFSSKNNDDTTILFLNIKDI